MPSVAGFAAVLLVAEVVWRTGIHCLNRLDGRGIENLYVTGMDELLAKDAAFFHGNSAGSLTRRVLSFASRFGDVTGNLVFNIAGTLVPLAFASVVPWRYDPLPAAGLTGVTAITGAGIAPLIRRRQRPVDQRGEAIARVSGHVAGSLMNMDTIHAFAAGDREAAGHRKRVAGQRRKPVRSRDYANLRIDALVAPMTVLASVPGLLLAVAPGAGQHGIEAIIVAFTCYSSATKIMFEFNQTYRQPESSLTEAAQFTGLLFTRPAVTGPVAPEPLRPRAGDVRLERVSSAYPGGLPLFTGPGLAVPSGTRPGLPGRPGGGQDHADPPAAADDGRRRRPDPDRRTGHRQAAQAAHATELAGDLPDGLGTMAGERGVKLPGGQRQRAALARAILRDAPILLLDEATSALDSESETLVQQPSRRLMQGRTAVVAAHRLSTIARMDQLAVPDRGQITGNGTHHELLRPGGTYARLWQHQSGGFLDDSTTTAMLPGTPRPSA